MLLVLVGLEHHTTLDRLVAMSTGIGSVLEQKVDILGKAQKNRIGLMDTRPSRGGLEVERWSDNRTDSASVGSNPV